MTTPVQTTASLWPLSFLRNAWTPLFVFAALVGGSIAQSALIAWQPFQTSIRTTGSAAPVTLPVVTCPTPTRISGRVIEASGDALRVQVGRQGWVTLESPYGRHAAAQRALGQRLSAGHGIYLEAEGEMVGRGGRTRFVLWSWREIVPRPGRIVIAAQTTRPE